MDSVPYIVYFIIIGYIIYKIRKTFGGDRGRT